MSMKCHICFKSISHGHHFLQCNNCKLYVHKKCNKLNDLDFKLLKSNPTWFCIVCTDDIFPFSCVSDQELKLIYSSNNISNIDKLASKITIFPSPDKNKLFTKFNNFFTSQALDSFENGEDSPSNPINCKYFNIDDFCLSGFDSNTSLSVFHMNVSSLYAHFDELNSLLTLLCMYVCMYFLAINIKLLLLVTKTKILKIIVLTLVKCKL